MSIVLREDPDLVPLCPHCGRELSEIVAAIPQAVGSARFKFGKRTIYACPQCRKALAITERKSLLSG